jgi:hypothetical protein
MNVYPEQPVIERMVVDGNIVGTRIEKYVLVATEAGSVVIPEVNLPWWDVTNNELRSSVIPASLIQITPAGGIFPGDAALAGSTASSRDANTLMQGDFRDELVSGRRTPAWILNLMAISIVLILAGMWLLWRRRQSHLLEMAAPAIVRTAAYERDIAEGHEKLAFAELETSLSKDSVQLVRVRLIAWGRQYFSDPGLHNLDDLASHMNSPEIMVLSRQLQASLYGSGPTGTNKSFEQQDRQRLLMLLKAERADAVKQSKANQQNALFELPPLYRQ